MLDGAQVEIDRNFDFFRGILPGIVDEHRGQFAVLHSRNCVGIYQTLLQAVTAASNQFDEGTFSIQEITDAPLDLGFFSHAGNQGNMC